MADGPPKPPPTFPRFFARISYDGIELACPHCGALDLLPFHRQIGHRPKGGTTQSRHPLGVDHFDPVRQRWICPKCQRSYRLGITAMPPRHGTQWINPDTVPTQVESDELRGLLLRTMTTRRDALNRACTCEGRDFYAQYDPACQMHHDEDQLDPEYVAWFEAYRRMYRRDPKPHEPFEPR